MIASTPNRIAPGTFLMESPVISKKPSADKKVSTVVNSPRVNNVEGWSAMMPPL